MTRNDIMRMFARKFSREIPVVSCIQAMDGSQHDGDVLGAKGFAIYTLWHVVIVRAEKSVSKQIDLVHVIEIEGCSIGLICSQDLHLGIRQGSYGLPNDKATRCFDEFWQDVSHVKGKEVIPHLVPSLRPLLLWRHALKYAIVR